jgi:autotransporter translocation and assembly factor TamB
MEGDLRVNKQKKVYRLDGTLRAVRGRYDLALGSIGALSREFQVDQGTVRYTGTPDLNAELNISARHVVRSVSGEEIPIIARISGTLYVPKVSLESDGTRQLSEADLTSYLLFGAPVSSALSGTTGNFVAASLFNSLASELTGKAGFDVFEVKYGASGGKTSAGAQAQVTFGKQIGSKTFLLGSGYFCSSNSSTNFGASLQYRFNRSLRAQLGIEPRTQFCSLSSSLVQQEQLGYQFGTDIFFEREF